MKPHKGAAMPQLQAAMPTLEIPLNTRETILTRKEMMFLNIRLLIPNLAFSTLYSLYCVALSIMFLYGGRELGYIEPFEHATVILGVLLFYSFILFASLCGSMRRMKLYGAPLLFGYTKDILYGASACHQAVNRWEFYARWKEVKGYFLLLSEGRWAILPKAIWSESEVSELRAIMREKIDGGKG